MDKEQKTRGWALESLRAVLQLLRLNQRSCISLEPTRVRRLMECRCPAFSEPGSAFSILAAGHKPGNSTNRLYVVDSPPSVRIKLGV